MNPRSRASRWLWALLFAWSVGCSVGVALAATPRQPRALELLVFGLDDDVFSRYGHVAVRVIEPDGRDRVFNFGVTSFNRPGYVAEFLEGRVKFWGKESSWARTLDGYKKADRDIVRHSLRLTPTQANALVARMEHDVLPEHREYIYDTFRENCATRRLPRRRDRRRCASRCRERPARRPLSRRRARRVRDPASAPVWA